MSLDWSFLVDSKWSISPGSNREDLLEFKGNEEGIFTPLTKLSLPKKVLEVFQGIWGSQATIGDVLDWNTDFSLEIECCDKIGITAFFNAIKIFEDKVDTYFYIERLEKYIHEIEECVRQVEVAEDEFLQGDYIKGTVLLEQVLNSVVWDYNDFFVANGYHEKLTESFVKAGIRCILFADSIKGNNSKRDLLKRGYRIIKDYYIDIEPYKTDDAKKIISAVEDLDYMIVDIIIYVDYLRHESENMDDDYIELLWTASNITDAILRAIRCLGKQDYLLSGLDNKMITLGIIFLYGVHKYKVESSYDQYSSTFCIEFDKETNVQLIDDDLAFEIFTIADNLGSKRACYYLGKMYENGWGTDESKDKAIEFYLKAANYGDEEAQNWCLSYLLDSV